ncbi:MAG: H+-translocating transhydrogenase subunit alpha [Chloroflexia bacterium]|jgi:NAD(P) transhydrogenase subunit alpha|nr:H+-translocating transhydrogenase subunit alpha [Chloroflexia bacterium]
MIASLAIFASTVAAQANETGTGMPVEQKLGLFFGSITIFVLAVFLGVELISKVPTTLHTPLMSGTNAIHGIVLVGAMVVAGLANQSLLVTILAFVAVIFAAGNVVGGFVVTDRMLQMFKSKRPDAGGKK